jgi:hypothetical protein
MNSKLLILSLLFFASLTACKKEPLEYNEEPCARQKKGCKSVVIPKGGNSWGLLLAKYGTNPCFNPNNPLEFVYFEDGNLIKYNYMSKVKTQLTYGVFGIGNPSWSKNGWILFADLGWKIWRVKEDGTGTKQITFGVRDLYPTWNPNDDYFLYLRGYDHSNYELEKNPELIHLAKMIKTTIEGAIIDSIELVWQTNSWNEKTNVILHESKAEGNYLVSLSSYNLNTKDTMSQLFQSKTWIIDFEWLNEREFLVSTSQSHLYKVDALTGMKVIIKKGCESHSYGAFSISGNKNKIVAEQLTAYYSKELDITINETNLVLMDIDGCNEEYVFRKGKK